MGRADPVQYTDTLFIKGKDHCLFWSQRQRRDRSRYPSEPRVRRQMRVSTCGMLVVHLVMVLAFQSALNALLFSPCGWCY